MRILLILLFVLSGCGGGGSGDRKPGFPDVDRLPVVHQFDAGGGLQFQAQSGVWLPVEFSPWGTHLGPHTGHAEGDPKNGWEVIIAPPGEMVEMVGHYQNPNGNQDGTCDPGETCGVPADVAKQHHVWFVNPFDEPLDLIHVNVFPQTMGYLDDTLHWQVGTRLPGYSGGHELGHMGALSDEVLALLEERVGPEIRTNPASIGQADFTEDPIKIPPGVRIGRGQLLTRASVEVNAQTIHMARSQIEWFTENGIGPTCAFLAFSDSDQANLQAALDYGLSNPIPGLKFDPDADGEIGLGAGAQAKLCTSDSFSITPYDTISTANSRSWTNVDDPREVLAIVPILSGTVGYQLIESRLSPRGGNYMARWATSNDVPIPQSLGIAFPLEDYQGQVLDLIEAGDGTGSFILSLEEGGPFIDGEEYFAVGLTFRLEPDRLVLRFGDVVTDLGNVVLPAPVEAGATCDGMRLRCYSRDWEGLNFPDQ